MANWQPDNNSLMQVIQLLKESQFPCNETQRAIQQVGRSFQCDSHLWYSMCLILI